MQGGVGDLAPPSVMSKIHCLMELSGLLVTWGGGGGGGGGEVDVEVEEELVLVEE